MMNKVVQTTGMRLTIVVKLQVKQKDNKLPEVASTCCRCGCGLNSVHIASTELK